LLGDFAVCGAATIAGMIPTETSFRKSGNSAILLIHFKSHFGHPWTVFGAFDSLFFCQ